jgi:DNA-binding beta-propeller fold protein YncE
MMSKLLGVLVTIALLMPLSGGCTGADDPKTESIVDSGLDVGSVDQVIDNRSSDIGLSDLGVDSVMDRWPDMKADSSPDVGIDTGLDSGADLHADSGADLHADSGPGSNVPFTLGVSTLAGWSDPGLVDGSRAVARFSNPVNVAYHNGKVYVAGYDSHRLRVIDTQTLMTSTLAIPQNVQRPFGLAFAPDGTLFFSTDRNATGQQDAMSGTVWKVDLANEQATVVAADIGRPRGLVVLPDGRLAASDYVYHVVRIIDVSTGQVSPLAGMWDTAGHVDGSGAAARFNRPYGIDVRSDGKLVVADRDNNCIRLVDLAGTATTIAGTGISGYVDGPAATAQFGSPLGIAIGPGDEVFITDTQNFRIRSLLGGQVTTVAGNGLPGYADHDDPLQARIYGLEGLSVTPDGSMLYVADGNRGEPDPYNRVRQVILK